MKKDLIRKKIIEQCVYDASCYSLRDTYMKEVLKCLDTSVYVEAYDNTYDEVYSLVFNKKYYKLFGVVPGEVHENE